MSDNTAKPTAVVKKPKAVNTQVKQHVVYCGPTLKNGVLLQYAVFQGELPAHVQKLAESEVAIKELIVDVKELSNTKKAIGVKGSRENQLYERALVFAKGGKR